MNNSRLLLAGAAALVWTAIATGAGLADAPTQTVRPKQVAANVSGKLRTAERASTASCQTITSLGHRIFGVAY